ncbi:hypothetical protein CI592_04920 [Fischerella thermalis CCMEE 5328]|nr:hypothetical protein CI592_04920 [Fischerella thermalis CCMEE 5328]
MRGSILQVLQNLAMQLEEEQCWRQGKLIENTVKILLQAENYKQRVITVIETEIKNALDSD